MRKNILHLLCVLICLNLNEAVYCYPNTNLPFIEMGFTQETFWVDDAPRILPGRALQSVEGMLQRASTV